MLHVSWKQCSSGILHWGSFLSCWQLSSPLFFWILSAQVFYSTSESRSWVGGPSTRLLWGWYRNLFGGISRQIPNAILFFPAKVSTWKFWGALGMQEFLFSWNLLKLHSFWISAPLRYVWMLKTNQVWQLWLYAFQKFWSSLSLIDSAAVLVSKFRKDSEALSRNSLFWLFQRIQLLISVLGWDSSFLSVFLNSKALFDSWNWCICWHGHCWCCIASILYQWCDTVDCWGLEIGQFGVDVCRRGFSSYCISC